MKIGTALLRRFGLLVLVGGSVALTPAYARTVTRTTGAAQLSKHVDNPVFSSIKPLLSKVTIPLRLPSKFPNGKLAIYADVDASSTGTYSYLVNIGYAKHCYGAGACRLAAVTGGPVIDTPTIFDYPHGKHIMLHGGRPALYFPYTCGANCGDSVVVWQDDGVVYTVSLKAGSKKDVTALANSALPT